MIFNATFNNISVISWWLILLVQVSGENHRSAASSHQLYHIIYGVHSPWVGFELSTLVMIGTDCTGSCKYNYHTITSTTAWCNKCVVWSSAKSKALDIPDTSTKTWEHMMIWWTDDLWVLKAYQKRGRRKKLSISQKVKVNTQLVLTKGHKCPTKKESTVRDHNVLRIKDLKQKQIKKSRVKQTEVINKNNICTNHSDTDKTT